jgi:hypothetical protein
MEHNSQVEKYATKYFAARELVQKRAEDRALTAYVTNNPRKESELRDEAREQVKALLDKKAWFFNARETQELYDHYYRCWALMWNFRKSQIALFPQGAPALHINEPGKEVNRNEGDEEERASA